LGEIYEFINLCKGHIFQERVVAKERFLIQSIIPIQAHLLNFMQLCEIITDSGGCCDYQFNSWIPINGDLQDNTSYVYKLMESLRNRYQLGKLDDEENVTIVSPETVFDFY